MRIAITVGGATAGASDDWSEKVAITRHADQLGVDQWWSAEAWGRDAVTQAAYMAAVTERIGLGTNIMQVAARSPAMTAMTAMTLAEISGNRFTLGLGASGPQVVEGLHGVRYQPALTRTRECVEICRHAFEGHKVAYEGDVYRLPLPGGEGKPLRLGHRPTSIPIYLAALGERSLELAGAVADGWHGTSFVPEAAEVLLAPLRRGAERAGRSLRDIDIQVGGTLLIDTGEQYESLLQVEQVRIARMIGSMGSTRTNFYKGVWERSGWADDCAAIERLWRDGRRADAAERVPLDLASAGSFIGSEEAVRERLLAYQRAGVTTVRFDLGASTLDANLAQLGTVVELVGAIRVKPSPAGGDLAGCGESRATVGAAATLQR